MSGAEVKESSIGSGLVGSAVISTRSKSMVGDGEITTEMVELSAGGNTGKSEEPSAESNGASVCREDMIGMVGLGIVGSSDGDKVGAREGTAEGVNEGCSELKAPCAVGGAVGTFEGETEGCNVGAAFGSSVR